MTNSINFQGGFLIKKPKFAEWYEIKANLPKKNFVVFDVFNIKRDSFIACKSHQDEQVADLLKSQDVSFKFFPDINLKSGLNVDHPLESEEIVKKQKRVITTSEKLNEYFKKVTTKKLLKQSTLLRMSHMEQTLKALGLTMADCNISLKRGITFINDKSSGRLIAQASQKSPMGFNYVYFYPECRDHSMERWIVYPNGEKKRVSVLNANRFHEKFIQNTKSKAKQNKIKS